MMSIALRPKAHLAIVHYMQQIANGSTGDNRGSRVRWVQPLLFSPPLVRIIRHKKFNMFFDFAFMHWH